MKSWLVSPSGRFNAWRAWLLLALMTALFAVSLVFLMESLLRDWITLDYRLSSLLAAGLMAPVSLFLINRFLRKLAREQQPEMTRRLERTEARLRVALDSSDEGVLMVAADGSVLSINRRFLELWRVPEALASAGQDALLLAHVRDQLCDPQDFLAGVKHLYGGQAEAGDTLQFKDGRVFQRYTRSWTLGDEEGRIWCFKDVSEQMHTREILANREEMYRTIVTQARDAITLIDSDTLRFVEFNDAACEGLGYTREEFARLGVQDIEVEADATTPQQRLTRISGPDIAHFETSYRHKDGSLRDVRLSLKGIQLFGQTRMVATWSDITERKQSEATLREQEELYHAIVSQAGDGIDLIDAQTLRFIEVNEAGCQMLGYRREELVHESLDKIQADLAGETLCAAVKRVMQAGQLSFENRHRCKDGSILEVQLNVRAIRLKGRDCMLGIWRDITERKRAQAALEESHHLLQTIIDAAPVRIFWKDRDLTYLGCNPAFARDAGMAGPHEVIGKDDHRMAWAAQAEGYRADDRAVINSGIARPFYEEQQTTPDGRTIWLRTAKVPLRNAQAEVIGVLGVYEDITGHRELAAALRQREQHQRALLDNFPFLVWLKDEESRFLAVNQVFADAVGQTPQALIGKSDLDIWPIDLAEAYRLDDAAVLNSGQPKHIEEAIEIDGRRVWFETYKSALRVESELAGTVGFSRNITERKELEAELQQHRQHLEDLVQQKTRDLLATEARASRILDSAADGLFGVDVEGRVTFINPAGCRMLGFSPEQVIGHSAHTLFHHHRADGSPLTAEECPQRTAWQTGRAARFDDETYWHADGHPVPVALATHPMMEKDRIVGAVISFVDTRAQRAAALAREQALAAAEALARARSEFLANMSHEIRTPMNGVLGFAHIGQRHCQNNEKARQAFEKIIASGNQLLGVVNEILDFSRIDAGKLPVEHREMSLSAALDGALELVADRARARNLVLRLEKTADLPATCVSDPLRIGQVLLNLLSNAVKFTEAGQITLHAWRQGEKLVFRVSDSGIGMTPEQLAYVFNPFQQADGSITRKFGGTGLGLAICKRLVELMQGEIRVDSQSGIGSHFEFCLPYVPAGAPAAPAAGESLEALPADRPLAGLVILLADDDPMNQVILETNLTEDGARVVVVGNGREAVERVLGDGPRAYDLVLMDIQMPEMDGYEATRRILDHAPHLPIVGQTAHAFREAGERCRAAGMVAHVTKPVDSPALVKLLLQILADRRGR